MGLIAPQLFEVGASDIGRPFRAPLLRIPISRALSIMGSILRAVGDGSRTFGVC